MLAVLAFACFGLQSAPEERIDDTEFERSVAVHVKAVESIEKTWRKDPASSA